MHKTWRFWSVLLGLSGAVEVVAHVTDTIRSSNKLVQLSCDPTGGSAELHVHNIQFSAITVSVDLEGDFEADQGQSLTFSIAARSLRSVPLRARAEALQPQSCAYTYYATWGHLEAQHDDSVTYALPYAPGEAFLVSQGFNGAFSHHGGDRYSIDWKMPVGTPIHAARAGMIVGVKDDSRVGGNDRRFEWDANYVMIEHTDGTIGHYVHLNRTHVEIGQKVNQGDLIGDSGNTGFSTGPHLHFAVFRARSGKGRETFPIRFATSEHARVELKTGDRFYPIDVQLATLQ